MKLQVLLCAALLSLPAAVASAEDLRDIENAASFRRIERLTHIDSFTRYQGGWTKPGENYSQLFAHDSAILLLNAWLGTSEPVLKVVRERTQTVGDYTLLGRTYESENGKEIYLDVLVPHPRHLMEAEMGLLKDFQSYEPPSLPIESKEEVKIRRWKGSFYEKKDGRCSLLMKMSKGSIINIESACSERADMIRLAEKLSLERYETMMNS